MNNKKQIQGTVVSNKNDKTIVVVNETYKKHAKYQKRVQYRKKFYAQDDKNEANVGDLVTIEECRPLSHLKRFRLISIDKKALEEVKVAEEKVLEEVLHEDKEEKKAKAKVEVTETPEVKEEEHKEEK